VSAHFFKHLEINYHNASTHPNALSALRSNQIQGILIHEVYTDSARENALNRLRDNSPNFLKTYFPEKFKSWFYGRNLNLVNSDLSHYFDEAKEFNQKLSEFLIDSESLPARITRLLSTLDHNRTFQAAPGTTPEQHYMFTTFRCHLPDGYIPPHIDDEFLWRPSYHHLAQLCQPNIISFVIAFSESQQGGETQVFNYHLQNNVKNNATAHHDNYASQPNIEQLDAYTLSIPAGSMFIFNSGKYLHRLSPVLGQSQRWTACSFMAQSNHTNATYCWG